MNDHEDGSGYSVVIAVIWAVVVLGPVIVSLILEATR